jgi:hypothetical protein
MTLDRRPAVQSLLISPNQRYIVTEDGSPFFYLGETAWELFHRCSREEADLLLTDRADKGFTVIQAVALAELDGLGTPNSYGELPLHDNDPQKPNEAYWKHVDWIVRRTNELGMYVGFLPTWGDKWHGPSSIFDVESARAYGEWLGHRYAEAGLIWILGGDRPVGDESELAVVRAMADGLTVGDRGGHLRTYHPPGGQSSSGYVHCESWVDFHMQQTGHSRERQSWLFYEHDWKLLPVRPFVNGEPPYEAHPNNFRGGEDGWLDQVDVRRELYWAICGGAAGFTYGCHAIWQMYEPPRTPINGPRATWKESLALPGSSQVRHAADLVATPRFIERVPATRHFIPAPRTAGPLTIRACTAPDSSWALVYVPDCQRVTVRLAALAGERFAVTFFNPRDGSRVQGEAVRGDEAAIQPPFDPEGRDWVILLDGDEKAT